MPPFHDRLAIVRRMYEQQRRAAELRLQSLTEQLRRQETLWQETERSLREMSCETQALVATHSSTALWNPPDRDKIVTLRQTTRAKIAELEAERTCAQEALAALERMLDQLEQARSRAWAVWRLNRRRLSETTQLERLLRDQSEEQPSPIQTARPHVPGPSVGGNS